MSIAIAIKVNDGFAIAADSATTLTDSNNAVLNIYNNVNKIVNLYKGLPIGMMFWDAGAIGPASMATIAKDLRRLLTDGDPADPFWRIDPQNYTIDEVAEKVRRYVYEVRYLGTYGPLTAGTNYPSIGMYVCGFGSDGLGREFEITIQKDGSSQAPAEKLTPYGHNLTAFASPDPIFRLIAGISLETIEALKAEGMNEADAVAMYGRITTRTNAQFVSPAMPIKDAIDLAEFLVHVAVMFYRFRPGHNTVGGPIEVAAITKHEGFKWVSRKLYFDASLNP